MNKLKNQEEFITNIINEINYLRQYPQKYAEKLNMFTHYFKGKVFKYPEVTIRIMTTEGVTAYEEAIKYLENQEPLEPLVYSSGLFHIAEDSLKEIQKFQDIGQMNDLDIDSLIENHGQVIGAFAQAVDFGSSLAELAIANLFVDDGDQTRGNRQNLLNPKFKLIGVATGNHKAYQYSTVILFARYFFEKGVKPGDLSDDNYTAESPKRKYNQEKDSKKEQEVESNNNIKDKMKDKNQKENYNEIMNNIKNLSDIEKKYTKDNDIKKEKDKEKFVTNNPPIKENKNLVVDDDADFDLPEGVLKIERSEKFIEEKGVKKKIIKLTKYMEDGDIKKEVYKELVK